jgi:hypothetical protein
MFRSLFRSKWPAIACTIFVSGGCIRNIIPIIGERAGMDATKSPDQFADCTNETNICGEFSQELRQLCHKFGGGKVCDTNRWNRQFYNDLVNSWREQQTGKTTAGTGPTGSIPQPKNTDNSKLPFVQVPDWPNSWNVYLADALDGGAAYLATPAATLSDLSGTCPRYNSLTATQRKIFWALMFASIAEYESGKNPQSCFRESMFSGVDENNAYYTRQWEGMESKPTQSLSTWLTRCHAPQRSPDVYSEGLLQLSYGDEEGTPTCEILRSLNNIRDPRVNLQCGAYIMSGLVARHHRLFLKPGPAYWSVLFPGKETRVLTHFNNLAGTALSFCQKAESP